jgi:hypothetical protein
MHLERVYLSISKFILEELLVVMLGEELSFEDDKIMAGMVINLVNIGEENDSKCA